jgi:hypothetical protein
MGDSILKRSLIKSKERVNVHGEVFTAEREVNAMLDLVKNETERIDSRFLEPACGDGNFLVEILRRKLAVVKKRYKKQPSEYGKYALIAVSSIYGVELLKDNAEECRRRLFEIFKSEYTECCGKKTDEECIDSARFILSRNILCGDALTLLDSNQKPIVFSEWAMVTGNMVKRRDFELSMLLDRKLQSCITSENGIYDPEIKTYLPKPIKEYPLTDYRRVQYADEQQ